MNREAIKRELIELQKRVLFLINELDSESNNDKNPSSGHLDSEVSMGVTIGGKKRKRSEPTLPNKEQKINDDDYLIEVIICTLLIFEDKNQNTT